jgi:hypothetical protein
MWSGDNELLQFGSILVNTERPKDCGDILPGNANATESNASDLRIVEEAPNGKAQWFERKPISHHSPRFDYFYYAVPVPGQGAAQAIEATADSVIEVTAPSFTGRPMEVSVSDEWQVGAK